jgi:hypothetical protein
MTCLARGDSRSLIRLIQLFWAEIGLCQLVLFDPLCEVLAVPEGTIIYASASGEVNFVESGETGICSEPCLYFEVRNGELPLDPMRYLP